MSGEPGVGGRVLLVDLGGGSCEITLSEHKRIKETVSVPLGAVRLTEEFLQADPPPAEGLTQMRQLIARELRRAHRRIQPANVSLVIATSGTAAALAEACAAAGKTAARQPESRQRATPGQAAGESLSAGMAGIAPTNAVRKLAGKMAKMTLPEREAVPGIGPRRAEIIVAGRAGVCRTAGELRAAGLSLFAAGPARRNSGADAGRAGCARRRPPGVRARTLGERAGHGAGATASIPGRPSRCARMPCSFSAS